MTENGDGGSSSVDSQPPSDVVAVLTSVDAEVAAEIRSIAATGVVRLPWSRLQVRMRMHTRMYIRYFGVKNVREKREVQRE